MVMVVSPRSEVWVRTPYAWSGWFDDGIRGPVGRT